MPHCVQAFAMIAYALGSTHTSPGSEWLDTFLHCLLPPTKAAPTKAGSQQPQAAKGSSVLLPTNAVASSSQQPQAGNGSSLPPQPSLTPSIQPSQPSLAPPPQPPSGLPQDRNQQPFGSSQHTQHTALQLPPVSNPMQQPPPPHEPASPLKAEGALLSSLNGNGLHSPPPQHAAPSQPTQGALHGTHGLEGQLDSEAGRWQSTPRPLDAGTNQLENMNPQVRAVLCREAWLGIVCATADNTTLSCDPCTPACLALHQPHRYSGQCISAVQ